MKSLQCTPLAQKVLSQEASLFRELVLWIGARVSCRDCTCLCCILEIVWLQWLSSTRLVTRTKESNIYASIVVEKPIMRNESEGVLGTLRWD